MKEEKIVKNEGEKSMKTWTGEDGIVYIEMIGKFNKEDILRLAEEIKEELKKSSTKAKLLVTCDFKHTDIVFTGSLARRELVDKVKNSYKDLSLEKVAVYVTSSRMRVVGLFITKASNISNIKIFRAKEEALKWLKQP